MHKVSQKKIDLSRDFFRDQFILLAIIQRKLVPSLYKMLIFFTKYETLFENVITILPTP